MSEADGGEVGFNRIRGSQVRPVLSREVVERQQHIAVLPKTFAGCEVLGVVLLEKVVECSFGSVTRFGLPDFVMV